MRAEGPAGLRSARHKRDARALARQAEQRSLDPACWLAERQQSGGRLLWAAAAVIAFCGLIVGLVSLRTPSVLVGFWAVMMGVHWLAAVWVAWEACHAFGEHRRTGLLELLMVTPLSVHEIIQGQRNALWNLYRGPVMLVGGTELVVFGVATFHEIVAGHVGGAGLSGVGFSVTVGGLVLWVADMLAVAWVGMWESLVRPRSSQAWGRTVLWVLVAPVFALLPATFILAMASPLLLPIKDWLFIQWAQGNLRSRFREVAAQVPALAAKSGLTDSKSGVQSGA